MCVAATRKPVLVLHTLSLFLYNTTTLCCIVQGSAQSSTWSSTPFDRIHGIHDVAHIGWAGVSDLLKANQTEMLQPEPECEVHVGTVP
jgi:hypothetical protein